MRNTAFFEGLADGFTCWTNLFAPRQLDHKDDSISAAWQEVGDCIWSAMGYVRDEEALSSPDGRSRAVAMTKRRLAALEAECSDEKKLLDMLEHAGKDGHVLRRKKISGGKQILVLEKTGTNGKTA